MSTLFVGGLSPATEELDLAKLIMPFGQINTIKIVRDKISGKPKGFAFVEMVNDAEANVAANELNGISLHDKELTINIQAEIKPNNQRPIFQPKTFNQKSYVKIERNVSDSVEKKKRPRRSI